ncbi:hypothetical protein [Aeromicrobium sp.]|uniref:hypothetical protein n=1 Tax=Aeromicrobium sp. TaxID=1871063 RepID=UPI003C4DF51A
MTSNEPPPYPGGDTPSDPPSDPPSAPPPPSSDTPGTSGLPSYGSVQPPADETPPPAPLPPPPAPGGSAEGFSAPDAIGWGWARFNDNVAQSLIAMLILIITTVVLGVIASLVGGGGGMIPTSGGVDVDGGSFIVSFIVGVIVSAASFIVTVAISRGTLDVADGGSLDIGAAFGKVDIGTAVVAGLLVGLLTQIGFLLLVVPGIIVTFFAYFTSYFVAEGSGAVEGIQKSFSLVAANLGDALVLAILSILVIIVGVIALCVGIFVAAPVTFFAAAYAFRKFQSQPVAA